jgi:hypothetical protein
VLLERAIVTLRIEKAEHVVPRGEALDEHADERRLAAARWAHDEQIRADHRIADRLAGVVRAELDRSLEEVRPIVLDVTRERAVDRCARPPRSARG